MLSEIGNTMKSFVGFAAILVLSILASCSDVAEPAPVIGIDEKLLVNNGWIVKSSIKDDGKAQKDLYGQYTTCVADNVFIFQSNSQYIIDEGAKKCDTTAVQKKESGSWKLKGSTLTISPDRIIPYQYTISSLTIDELVFTYLEIGFNGIVNSTTTITFKPLTGI